MHFFSLKKHQNAYLFLLCFIGKIGAYLDEENYPRFLTAAVGDYIVFDCEIDFPQGYPIPYKLYWKREDKEIFTSYNGEIYESDDYVGRITLLDKHRPNFPFHPTINHQEPHYGRASINLTSIRESDAGWYECKTMFPTRTPPYRNNGTWFHLTVSGGNLLAIPPINVTVQEGEEARFMCVVKDYSIRLRWLKDSIPLTAYQDLTQRSWIEKDGTLVIHPTDMGDFGEYECEASNNVGDVQKGRAYLNVQYKAKVVYAPPEIHLPFGRPALIDCHFRANPPLTNLRWEKDGFLFDPYNIQGVFYRKNGSLYFNKVDETHAGSYTCTPYNDLGTQGPSPAMYVIVQRAPVFTRTPHNLYLKKLGETVEIPCDARDGDSGHKPMIVWYKKGSSLPIGRYSINEGNLTITDIEEDDRGIYQCSATNKAATVSTETELLVENIPSSAPYNLTAVTSATSVHITWLSRRQKNVEFSVWYKKIESTEWKTYQVPSTRTLEATVTNLEPGTEYELMVLCKDDNGDGPFSKSIRVWTKNLEHETNLYKGPAPLGYPRHIIVTPTDDGLLVTWEPPEFGMELFKTYVVRWTQGPDDAFVAAETPETNYHIQNLVEGTEYDIQVLAVSIDEQQAISEKIRALYPGFKSIRAISTGPAPLGYPRHIIVTPTDDGLLVTWEPPEFGMELFKTYVVRWTQGPDDAFVAAETPETNYHIQNLVEGTEYDIQVLAVSIDEQQAISEKIRALYPGFKSIRAISTGIIAGLVFLGVIFAAVFFIKKRFFSNSPQLLKK